MLGGERANELAERAGSTCALKSGMSDWRPFCERTDRACHPYCESNEVQASANAEAQTGDGFGWVYLKLKLIHRSVAQTPYNKAVRIDALPRQIVALSQVDASGNGSDDLPCLSTNSPRQSVS